MSTTQPVCEGPIFGTCPTGFTCTQDPDTLEFECVSNVSVPDDSEQNNTLWIILGVVGGVLLLLAIVVLLWMVRDKDPDVTDITETIVYR